MKMEGGEVLRREQEGALATGRSSVQREEGEVQRRKQGEQFATEQDVMDAFHTHPEMLEWVAGEAAWSRVAGSHITRCVREMCLDCQPIFELFLPS